MVMVIKTLSKKDATVKISQKAVPTYYLTGKKAEGLDKLVEEGLKEYKEGKTIKAPSVREAMKFTRHRKSCNGMSHNHKQLI